MIHLDVEKYCHICPDFDVQVTKPFSFIADQEVYYTPNSDIHITCSHAEHCARVFKFAAKKEADNGG